MKEIRSKTVVLSVDDIDTDQIIPARFLKVTTRLGLGKHLFADWPERPPADGEILVAGKNFGCGSSREHAVWSLMDFGFRAVVSSSIADIFRNNALKNGLIPVVVDEKTHRRLLAQPGAEVAINLEKQTIDGVRFDIDPFARYRLLRGIDELEYLLDQVPEDAECECPR